jgi:GT2 family glycosyltransferase
LINAVKRPLLAAGAPSATQEVLGSHRSCIVRPVQRDSPDLSIIVVSTNEARWLDNCLRTVFDHAGDARIDVIVVDNESTDGTRELVERRFPAARVVDSANRGFAHGNNRGLQTSTARYVLFLNPDTEILEGTFGALVRDLDARPEIGLVGVRQLRGNGELHPTVRRFPSASRALGEALLSERWPFHPSWAGERVLDHAAYEREYECDWTSGSFMLARREALESAGCLDERFFIYSEEPDLCRRIKRDGWRVVHVPTMSIVHHANKAGIRPRMVAQDAYARRQYARKHFSLPYAAVYLGAVATRHAVRAMAGGSDVEVAAARRRAARLALRTLVGLAEPPFGQPAATAVIASRARRTAAAK